MKMNHFIFLLYVTGIVFRDRQMGRWIETRDEERKIHSIYS